MKKLNYDIIIVGCGVAGLYTALHLPQNLKVLMISKDDITSCDSMLAQGGICVMRDEDDYQAYYEDTMRAGHYENSPESVSVMIHSSREIIEHLLELGVRFEKNLDGTLAYTREGAHSKPRICYYKDITGKEITTTLLSHVRSRSNVTIWEYMTMTDLLIQDGACEGIIAKSRTFEEFHIYADDTVLATGGVGGLYQYSTNYPILTGDGCRIAGAHGVQLLHMEYVQIHPTCLYRKDPGRNFLISESARGEGAILLNHEGKRFVDELLPRDRLTKAILNEMEREGKDYMYLSFEPVSEEIIHRHFPNILERCQEEGYDITREPIPIVPAQHYFMGGIGVDREGRTTMPHLYAVGETSCNGVHGKNRLASNSLLESLVFAKRSALQIRNTQLGRKEYESSYNTACS